MSDLTGLSAILSKGLDDQEAKPETPATNETEAAPEEEPPHKADVLGFVPLEVLAERRVGRPPGKRSDPDYERLTVLVPKHVRKAAERHWEDMTGRDMSELVGWLLGLYMVDPRLRDYRPRTALTESLDAKAKA